VNSLAAVVNPLLPGYRAHELEHVWRTAQPSVVVIPDVHRDHDHRALVAQVAATTAIAPHVVVVGEPAPGISSGTAMARVEAIAAKLPPGIGYEWSGLSFQEKLSGSQAPALYAISIVFVFLCLAALYESWSLPFSVMLVVPLGVIGALLAAWTRGLANDVYFQVGLLTTVGLAAKNAILIVEFARNLHEAGMELTAAILQTVRIRLRPILMTSLSFMLGVLPLVLSTGAGAAGRIAIGTGVFGGMLAATVLGIFFAPLFFVVVQRLKARRA
jgi:HAE1 family hydrophobic/amphiphilic exporter-1/multidrug efflux pump